MSLAGFPFQRFANGLLDGRDLEGILFYITKSPLEGW
jgi:hypothetical protein